MVWCARYPQEGQRADDRRRRHRSTAASHHLALSVWALAAVAVMIAAIATNFWLLDFIHVFTGLLWTGIDLFMGFVLGPILRRTEVSSAGKWCGGWCRARCF